MTHTPSPVPRGTAPRSATAVTTGALLLLGALVTGLVLAASAPADASASARAASTTGEAADAALDWLEGELADNSGTLPGPTPGTTDWGLSADAALGLLLHGRGVEPITAALVDDLLVGLDDYTTWDALGAQYAGVRLAGPLAKALLVAETADRPTTVAGLDLPTELLGLMTASGDGAGRFGDRNPHSSDGANMIGQSLAILALSHDPAGPPAAAVQFLLSRQCPAGGFPLQSTPGACDDDADADPDATALALDALLCAPRTEEVTAALGRVTGWLLGRADATTGAFGGVGPTAGSNANSTGLIGHALAAAAQGEAAGRAATWVIEQLQLGAAAAGTPAAGEVGAIAYDPGARSAALSGGIDSLLRDQWRRAGTQAVLTLDAPPLGVPEDEPPVAPATTTTTTTTTTVVPTTTTAPPPSTTVGPTSTATTATVPAVAGATAAADDDAEELAVTGSSTAAMVVAGSLLLLAGAAALAGGRVGRRAGLGIVAVLGGFGASALGAPREAGATAVAPRAAVVGSEGACPSTDGVTVVVDFAGLGGGVHVRCAPGSPASGFDALDRAGIAYDTALRSGGFLCRIAGKPATDPCIDPSPASAHWSYWLAERGGSWCYSSLGAGNRRPPQGTVEGWSFVQGSGAADARPPAADPPAAVTGAGTLAAADCDRSATAPTTPPVIAAPVTPAAAAPPAGQPTAGSGPPPADPVAGLPPDGGTGADDPAPGAGGSTTGAPGDPAVTTSIVPSDTAAPPATDVSTPAGSATFPGAGDAETAAARRSAQEASTVDLSDGGRNGGAGPFGTVAAAGGAAALLAGAVVLRRRRDRPQDDTTAPDAESEGSVTAGSPDVPEPLGALATVPGSCSADADPDPDPAQPSP